MPRCARCPGMLGLCHPDGLPSWSHLATLGDSVKTLLAALTLFVAAPASADDSSCMSAFGQTECGWSCAAGYGQVHCGHWPGANCEAAYGQVICGPEPTPGWRSALGTTPPKAECMTASGSIACGYGCIAAVGQVKCANTPAGSCTVANGEITCFDPPIVPVLVGVPGQGVPSLSEAECLSAYGQTACGYHCTASGGQVNCASEATGMCVAVGGAVVCNNSAPVACSVVDGALHCPSD